MTPEQIAAVVTGWVRAYTRGLPRPAADRRATEIAADLHDHIAHERARGTADTRIALGVASRMVRGLPADVSWRRKERMRTSTRNRNSALRIAAVTALVLLIPATGMATRTDGVDWGVFDFVLAAVLVAGAGLLVEMAVRRPHSVVFRVAAAVVAVLAIVLGEADDAPGLVLFGFLLGLGAVALTIRTRLRSG